MNRRSYREKIVPSWSLWHHPRRNPTKTFFQDKFSFLLLLVFIPAVLFPFKMLSNLLCNFIMDLQFYYGLAILSWILQFYYGFALLMFWWIVPTWRFVILLWVCNYIMGLQFLWWVCFAILTSLVPMLFVSGLSCFIFWYDPELLTSTLVMIQRGRQRMN